MKSYRNPRILVVLGLPSQFLGASASAIGGGLSAGTAPSGRQRLEAEAPEAVHPLGGRASGASEAGLGTTKEVIGFIDFLDFKDFLGFPILLL